MSAAGKPPALRPAQHQRESSANTPRNGEVNINGSLSVPRSAGKSKRTLIENACAACRRRKSRVGAAFSCNHSRCVRRLTQLRSAMASGPPAHAARRSRLAASTKPKKAKVAGLRSGDATKSWKPSALKCTSS